MTVTYNDLRSLIRPGGMYSADDLIKALTGVLNDSQMTQLAAALASTGVDQIRPGDLIKSDVFNQILSDVADLQQRVAKLESGSSSPDGALQIFRLEGDTPIRVGSRVTAVGKNFSVPGTRNIVTIDGKPVSNIDINASTAERLIFNVVDPGLGGTGRRVDLAVVNADAKRAYYSFQLEPAIKIPEGVLAVTYDVPPAGTNLDPGDYDFGFKLSGNMSMPVRVRINADLGGASGWSAKIMTMGGQEITSPVDLTPDANGLIEGRFNIHVAVPSGGTVSSANLAVGAVETIAGISAPTSTLSLNRGQTIPVPEKRVTVSILNALGVTLSGGAAIFVRNQRGRLDFRFDFDLGQIAAGAQTDFALSFALDEATKGGWIAEPPSITNVRVTGRLGRGDSGIAFTPGGTAGNTRLLVSITGTPAGQNPLVVTYAVPLLIS